MFRIEDEVAAVSGAKGKLGPIWIEALLQAGARVAALDLPNAKPSEQFERLLVGEFSERLHLYDCDVTDRRSLQTACDTIAGELVAPGILVNNAGIDQPPDSSGSRDLVQDLAIDQFRRMVEVNLLGTFQATQVFGQAMVERGRGSIVNIGSLYASVSPDQRFYDHFPGEPPFLKSPAYGASKAGVVNLTRFFSTLWGLTVTS